MRRSAVAIALVLVLAACNTSVCLRKSDCPSHVDAGTASADTAPDGFDAAPLDASDATPDSVTDAPDGGP